MRYLVIALAALTASVGFAAPQRGRNLLENPSFERTSGARASGWQPFGQGYVLSSDEARDGRLCIVCTSAAPEGSYGAMQEITFAPPLQQEFKVSGWGKAENVAGDDYCIWLDCWYEDGTNLWGKRGSFQRHTHDWQYLEWVLEPAKPISKIQYFVLFRRCTGQAWFDDLHLSLMPFATECQTLAPSLYGGNSIDYRARLSMPCDWRASVLSGGHTLHSSRGQGEAIKLAWLGTDRDGRLLPGGQYSLRIVAEESQLGEKLHLKKTVSTRSGTGRGYAAWVESSMKRALVDCFPETVADSPTASVALAGNEWESFQVALRAAPGRDLRDCRVEISDLQGDGEAVISAANLQWHQVGFVELKRLFRHPQMRHALPGWWPDPLLPVSEFDVPGGVTQALWVTVYAPPGTPAGKYHGKVTVTPANAQPFAVSLNVTVYGFDLPVQPHIKTAFALMDGYLERIYGKLTPQLRRAYGDYLLKHRLNPDDISRAAPPAVDDIAYYYDRGLNAFNVLNLVEPRGSRPWVCRSPLSVYVPEFKAELVRRLDAYVAELKRRRLIDKAYVYGFDEQGESFYPVIREYFGLIKQRYGFPTLTTAAVPQTPQALQELNVDWSCPLASSYVLEEAEKCRAAGLQVWSYVCNNPRYPYANWLADDPLIEARVIWWQVYHQKLDGFLYWGLNIWHRRNNDYVINPASDGPRLSWSITTATEGWWAAVHGDGELLYPGREGPIGSIRLANIRDGIEDYEYLWLLADLEGNVEKGRAACLPVTRSLTEVTRDPDELYAQREKIARRIERLLAPRD